MGVIVTGIKYAGRLLFRSLGGLNWLTPLGSVGNQFDSTPVNVRLVTTARPTDTVVFMVAAGQLPPGLSLNMLTGEITGSPLPLEDTTTYFFTISATSNGNQTVRTFNFTVRPNFAPEWLTGETLGNFVDLEPVTIYLEAEDANQGQVLTYSLTGGDLPAGLTLSESGAVTGVLEAIPSETQNRSFTVTATDGLKSAQRTFLAVINRNLPPVWVTNQDAGEGLGNAYISIDIMASDPNGRTVTYELDENSSLPPSITLTTQGKLSGTLPAAVVDDVEFSFTVNATDGVFTVTRQFTVTALFNIDPVFSVSPEIRALSNVAFSKTFTAVDPTGQSEITYSSADLPEGLVLNPTTGVLTGTMVTGVDAQYQFTVRASNGEKQTDLLVTLFVAADVAPVWITEAGSIGSLLGYDSSALSVRASDPNGLSLTYSLISGELPRGLVFGSGGNITGKASQPTVDATYTFVVEATDGVTAIQREFSIFVGVNDKPQWTTPTVLGSQLEGELFTATIEAFDPDGRPTTVAPFGGALPIGFTFDQATGTLSGLMPAVAKNTQVNFVFAATDTGPIETRSVRTFTAISIFNKMPVWVTTSMPRAVERTPYSFQLTVDHPGNDGFQFAVTSGALPDGLTLDATTGIISGTPAATTVDLTATFEITVTNEIGSASREFSPTGEFTSMPIQFNRDPVWVTEAGSLVTTLAKNPLTLNVLATDFNATPLSYSSADLPAGLTLNAATGEITGQLGIVQDETVYEFTVEVTDQVVSIPRTFSVTVLADSDPIWTTGADLGLRVDGKPTSFTLVASDPERNAITYTLLSGEIPAGMTLVGNTLNGTPVVEQDTDYTFELEASDGIQTITREFSITIQKNVEPVWVTASDLGELLAGYAVSIPLVATDANGENITLTRKSGTLPSGLSLNSSGSIATSGNGTIGLVDEDTDYTFIITATDGEFSVDREFTLRILRNEPPVFNVAAGQVFSGIEEAEVDIVLDAVDAEGREITYAKSGASYLDINASTGQVTGTLPSVTADRIDTFTVTARDGAGTNGSGANISSREYTVQILFASAPSWTTGATLPAEREGRAYSRTLVAVAGGSPVTHTVQSGTLPAGLTLSSAGLLSGTLGLVNGNTNYQFTVRATGLYGFTDRQFSLNVIDNIAPVWITPAGNILTGAENEDVSFTLEATDADDATVTYQLVFGNLPGTITLNETTGVLSGNLGPVEASTEFSFVVGAFDGAVRTERTFVIKVQNLLEFQIIELDFPATPTTALLETEGQTPGEWSTYTGEQDRTVILTHPATAVLNHSRDVPVMTFSAYSVGFPARPASATLNHPTELSNATFDARQFGLNTTTVPTQTASLEIGNIANNVYNDSTLASVTTTAPAQTATQNT